MLVGCNMKCEENNVSFYVKKRMEKTKSPTIVKKKETYKPLWLGGSRNWREDLSKSFQEKDAQSLCKLKLLRELSLDASSLDKEGNPNFAEGEDDNSIQRDPTQEAEDRDPNAFWVIKNGFKLKRQSTTKVRKKGSSTEKEGSTVSEWRGYCGATSLYGWDYVNSQRQGTPLADFFALSYHPVGCVEAFLAVADGAGWGEEALRAAEIAVKSSVMHLKQALNSLQSRCLIQFRYYNYSDLIRRS